MTPSPLVSLFQTHSRSFEDNRFVYAVVSRRSGGVSIGVNLNPEKYCNFDCVYCQVDRTVRGGPVLRKIDLPQLAARTGRNGRTGRHRPAVRRHAVLDDAGRVSPAQRYCHERRRRADRLADLRRSGATLRRHSPPPRSRPGETRVDHQRHAAPSRAGPQVAGSLGRQQRRDLGQARCRHGGVLPGDRPLEGQTGRGAGEPRGRGPQAADRDSIAIHAAQRRAAAAGRARGLLRSALRNRRRRRADQAGADPHDRPAPGRELCLSAGECRSRRPGGVGQETYRAGGGGILRLLVDGTILPPIAGPFQHH